MTVPDAEEFLFDPWPDQVDQLLEKQTAFKGVFVKKCFGILAQGGQKFILIGSQRSLSLVQGVLKNVLLTQFTDTHPCM